MSRPTGRRLIAENRRARHDYELLEKMEAGMVLKGTEVKSIRGGKVQLKGSYIEVRNGDAYLIGAHVSPYSHGNIQNHDPERPRRLLLSRREIDRIFGKITRQGLTCVPLSVYLSGNLVKLEIAIARGKRLYDKRQAEKKKQMLADAQEAIRGSRR